MAFDNEELNKLRQQRQKQKQSYSRQMKYLKIGAITAACILVLCGAVIVAARSGWLSALQNPEVSAPPASQAPAETSAPVLPDTVIHLAAGGDINISDKVISSGLSGSSFDFSNTFLDVTPVLAGADLSVVNFEGNLYGAPFGTDTHSAPPEMMQALKNAGVDIVQTANSHSLTNGLLGLSATLDGIRQTGIQSVGTYRDKADFEKYQGFLIREVQGIRIAFVAFTKGMDGRGLPEGNEDCVNLLYTDYTTTYQKVDTEGITRVLRAAEKAKPDLTIALLHWGSEYNDQISKSQKKIIKIMEQEGVDAILGTHPHYVQSAGFDPETGMFVAYSLGDLLGDAKEPGSEYSVLLDLEITKSGADGKTTLTDFNYTPIYQLRDKDGHIRIVRIQQAISAYESNCIDKLSEEDYLAMKSTLEKIETRIHKKI